MQSIEENLSQRSWFIDVNKKVRDKKKGFFIVETVMSIVIISIFISILYPILKYNTRLNNKIYFFSVVDRKKRNVMSILNKQILIARDFYEQRRELESNRVEIINFYYKSKNFKNRVNKGNAILIKLPVIKKEKIRNYFLVFQFYRNNLYVYEGEYKEKRYGIKNKGRLINNIEGSFEKVKEGVMITMKFKEKNNNYSLKAYERIR